MKEGLFIAVSALAGLCAKHASRVSRKLRLGSSERRDWRIAPGGSPFSSPKQLVKTLSNKANFLCLYKKKSTGEEPKAAEAEEGMGDGGLWQREILMGEKCQPLDFSGVIYYDYDGKRVPEFPPRSPLRGTVSLGLAPKGKGGN